MTRLLVVSALAVIAMCFPLLSVVFAAEAVAVTATSPIVVAPADTSVVFSIAPWISLLQQILTAVVIPAVGGIAFQAIKKVYPWATLFLTQARIEQMANAVTEYAINAVPQATKDAKLTVNVGSAVIAKAVQRAADAAPAKVIEAAGGLPGLAAIVYRKLNLADDATEANTLKPVIANLPRNPG